MKNTGLLRRTFRHRQIAFALALVLPAHGQAGVEIDQTPLTVGKPLEPNIMFIMDDSGSMRWQHMPGTAAEWYSSPPNGLPYRSDLRRDIRLRASNVNTQWYNPLITYAPWVKYDGSSWGDVDPRNARFDPSGTANTSNGEPGVTKVFDLGSTDWPSVDLDTSSTSTIDQEVWRYRGFYVLNPGGEPTKDQDYKRYEFRLKVKCTETGKKGVCTKWGEAGGWEARVFSLKSDGTNNGDAAAVTGFSWPNGTVRTVEEEIQNYANWFSYYRLRSSMAKAAASRVFSELGEDYRVGYNTIWNRQDFPIPVGTDKGLFKGNNKEEWFKRLFLTGTNQGTPLRESLGRTGEYFRKTGVDGPYGPESPQLSCRQNFAIMTTDGYWNSNEASNPKARDDNDSTDGDLIESSDGKTYKYSPESPYKDGSGERSNTLADVAMYYWKTDLTSLENNVPTTGMNPAFWQHMRTFGVSIGEKGTIDPAADLSTIKSWPNPNDAEDADRIDDLFHASVNSRGKFLVASNPEEFARSLTAALATIASETGRAASGAANSTSVDAGTMTYFTEYSSGSWNGDVRGYKIDPATGKASTKPGDGWAASENLPVWDERNIKVSKDGVLDDFRWGNLSSTQRSALGSEDIVNYLRGDRSKEKSDSNPSGTLRARDGLLGSFVNSQPIYVAKPTFGAYYEKASTPGAADYKAYATAKASRLPVLYVGGNDGMLHGFNAQTGEETFAFVPAAVITEALRGFAAPDYEHRYFVDGELTVADAYLGGVWRTILVGSLGRGGKGVFALDVTDPMNVSLLWEKSASDIAALGNALGKPIIAEVGPGSDWRAVFGNGPNGVGDKAQLITISLKDGSVSVIDTGVGGDNGLSAPLVWDADKNGTFETVYAGDLKGNVWRFDDIFSNSPPVPFRLFTAEGNRPITASPWAAVNQRDLRTWVFVGTGQYLNETDRASVVTQSWYGLIDADELVNAADLVERSVGSAKGVDGRMMRTVESGSASELTGKKGWYIDFNETGERMITPNMFYGSALIGTTFVPDGSDLCKPGGRSALWGIDPFTGARLNKKLFSNFGTIDGVFPSVLDGLKPILVGNPPVTISEKDKVTKVVIHTDPSDSEEFSPPPGEAELQSWREVVGRE